MDMTLSLSQARETVYQNKLSELERHRQLSIMVTWVSLSLFALCFLSAYFGDNDKVFHLVMGILIITSTSGLLIAQSAWDKIRDMKREGPGAALLG